MKEPDKKDIRKKIFVVYHFKKASLNFFLCSVFNEPSCCPNNTQNCVLNENDVMMSILTLSIYYNRCQKLIQIHFTWSSKNLRIFGDTF